MNTNLYHPYPVLPEQATFPVSSGERLNSICPAEAGKDTTPFLNGESNFQYFERAVVQNRQNNDCIYTSNECPATNNIQPGCHTDYPSVVFTPSVDPEDISAYHFAIRPVLSGKLYSGICPAVARVDTAPNLNGGSYPQLNHYVSPAIDRTPSDENRDSRVYHLAALPVLSGKSDSGI